MGNFCGDYIKGRLDSEAKKAYPEYYLTGIRLHRFIDNFTDTDPTVKRMTKEVAHYYGRAAPIAVDICFDHFLANSFSDFHGANLKTFLSSFYGLVRDFSHLIPPPMQPLALSLIENDWLFRYQEWSTVERTYKNMSRRYPFLSALAETKVGFRDNLSHFKDYFFDFYPRLQQACAAVPGGAKFG